MLPRITDERKLNHARELLRTSLSINDIREQLTILYGSGMSPNKLLELRHDLVQKKKGFSLFSKKPSSESSLPLFQAEFYNSMMNDIDQKLEKHIFLIFNKLELQDKSHTRDITTEIKNLRKNTAEMNFFQYFTTIKSDVLDFLTHRWTTFEALVQGLELSEDLTKLALMDLENDSQLLLKANVQGEIEYHKIPKGHQFSSTESGLSLPEDPRTQLEIEEIKDALDDPLRELRSQLILKRKDESLIYVALEQIINKWKNPTDD
jgi:hypothetical protein